MKRVVLVRTQGPRNVGSVMRAVANFGPVEFVLVAPQKRSMLVHPDFTMMAHGVEKIRERIRVVPTLAEAGLSGYSAYVWMGLLAPKGTPKAVIDLLNTELRAVIASPELQKFFNEAGMEVVGSSPSEMDAYFREERDRWARIVKETGARID